MHGGDSKKPSEKQLLKSWGEKKKLSEMRFQLLLTARARDWRLSSTKLRHLAHTMDIPLKSQKNHTLGVKTMF